MSIANKQIAEALETIGILLDLNGENSFKVRAYENAARLVSGWDGTPQELVEQAQGGAIKGIGKALAEKIAELVETGSLEYLEELKAQFPAGLFDMLRIAGLGPKKVRVLYKELGISTLGELEYACMENRLVEVKGFGQKTQDNILAGIARLAQYSGRFRIPVGLQASVKIVDVLVASGLADRIEVGGSLRRRKETIKDIDILATSAQPEKLIERFVALPEVTQITGQGPTKASVVLASGIAVDLRVVADNQFAPALLYFTGSKEHNTQLRALAKKLDLKLNEYGLYSGDEPLPLHSEEEIYRRLGLRYIPPELREGLGEVEFAAAHDFPPLIEIADIKGVVHAHTTYSDGAETLPQLAEAVRLCGYQYLGVSDHSQSAYYAGGLREDDIKRQHEEIDKLNEQLAPFRIFKGIESDILPDGALDYPDDILARFDFVIASVHSHFGMDESRMTERLIRAAQNPFTRIMGHLTGRLLLSREGYPVNVPAVLEACSAAGTAIEINAHPYRLDLDWRYHRRAKELGIPLAICPDAHAAEGIADIAYGVGVARKGWLTADDVLTAWTGERVAAYFARKP